jgi:hypothetical protein
MASDFKGCPLDGLLHHHISMYHASTPSVLPLVPLLIGHIHVDLWFFFRNPRPNFERIYSLFSSARLAPRISHRRSPSSTRRAKPTSGRAIAYEHGEMIMDTTPDYRDGSLDPDDDGEGGMNGQLGTGQAKNIFARRV